MSGATTPIVSYCVSGAVFGFSMDESSDVVASSGATEMIDSDRKLESFLVKGSL